MEIVGDIEAIIVRRHLLHERYGAHLLQEYLGKLNGVQPVILIEEYKPLNWEKEVPEAFVEHKRNTLIVGGHYNREALRRVAGFTKKLIVFYNSSDDRVESPQHISVQPGMGFAEFVVSLLREDQKAREPPLYIPEQVSVMERIADLLSQYICDHPSDQSKLFNKGLRATPTQPPSDESAFYNLISIRDHSEIGAVITRGEYVHASDMRCVVIRKKFAIEIEFELHKIFVAVADNLLVDTTIMLAECSRSGIGMAFRYDLRNERTLITLRVIKDSGLVAGKLIRRFIASGGGTKAMAGGSVEGLWSPREFFKQPLPFTQ